MGERGEARCVAEAALAEAAASSSAPAYCHPHCFPFAPDTHLSSLSLPPPASISSLASSWLGDSVWPG